MQIDDRYHDPFTEATMDGVTPLWAIPYFNIGYGAALLRRNYQWIMAHDLTGGDEEKALRAALSAYNCGLGRTSRALRDGKEPDQYTTGGDYADWVLKRAEMWRVPF
jgi:hypothetical protein